MSAPSVYALAGALKGMDPDEIERHASGRLVWPEEVRDLAAEPDQYLELVRYVELFDRLARAEAVFPAATLQDAVKHLRRPFSVNAVKFKLQSVGNTRSGGGWAIVVAYIDARLVVDRINLVCPQLWTEEEYVEQRDGTMACFLTIDGRRRSDVGEGTRKALRSDALKRAAVKFGIGHSLYAMPEIRLFSSDGHLRQIRTKKGPSWDFSDEGKKVCRDRYAEWLETIGTRRFGEPLDHGDAEGAIGDFEGSLPPAEDEIDGDHQGAMDRCVQLVMDAKQARAIDSRKLELLLTNAGATETTGVNAALRTMTVDGINQAASALADLIAAKESR